MEKDTRIKKIRNSQSVDTYRAGNCIIASTNTNKIGLPYILDLNTNKIKTVAQKVYEEKNGKIEKGYIVRPICGNMNCINLQHLEKIKVS